MATPELGHRTYGYTLLDCIVESQECSIYMISTLTTLVIIIIVIIIIVIIIISRWKKLCSFFSEFLKKLKMED